MPLGVMRTSPLLVCVADKNLIFQKLMIDWIQDSLHERNIRAKGPMRRNPIFARLDQMDGFLGYIWRLISQVLEEGESWVVLSLVGQSIEPLQRVVLILRCRYRTQCSSDINHDSLAIRSKDGILYHRLVVIPKILLFGSFSRRRRVFRMEKLGRHRTVPIHLLHHLCGKLAFPGCNEADK